MEVTDNHLSSELSSVPSTIENEASGGTTETTLLDVVAQLKAEVKTEVKEEVQRASNTRFSALEFSIIEKMETRLLQCTIHSRGMLEEIVDGFRASTAAQVKTEIMADMREQQEQFAHHLDEKGSCQEIKELRSVVSGLKVQVDALYALLAAQRDSA
jgi:hypothetical protein